jgi:hypothetical protein
MALPVFQGVKLLASAYELLIDLAERKIAESLIDRGRASERVSCKVGLSEITDARADSLGRSFPKRRFEGTSRA